MFPNAAAQILVGQGKRQVVAEAADEGRVDAPRLVGGHEDDALVLLHPLEQIGHLGVGVFVLGVLYLAALAQQGVGLVEEQNHVAFLRLVKHLAQTLFRLADVLVHNLGQVHLIELQPQPGGQHLGRHGLARARRAGQEDGDAPAIGIPPPEAPAVQYQALVLHLGAHRLETGLQPRLQLQVVPGVGAVDKADVLIPPVVQHLVAQAEDVPLRPGSPGEAAAQQAENTLHLAHRQVQLGGQTVRRKVRAPAGQQLCRQVPPQLGALGDGGLRDGGREHRRGHKGHRLYCGRGGEEHRPGGEGQVPLQLLQQGGELTGGGLHPRET